MTESVLRDALAAAPRTTRANHPTPGTLSQLVTRERTREAVRGWNPVDSRAEAEAVQSRERAVLATVCATGVLSG